ncbi:MAG: NTP transferase domain-containing protein [Minicystis sp.]
MSQIITIVVAAGAGKRIGGPKALLAWPSTLPDEIAPPRRPEQRPGAPVKDRPLAIAHAEMRLAAESKHVLIVTRGAFIPALFGYVRPGIDLLASDAADDLGAAGSLAFAVSRLPRADRIIVTPVDTVPARAATVAHLLLRLADEPKLLAVRPVYHGRAGHPVVLRPEALEPYRGEKPPPLRDHLRALGDLCADQDVNDPTILIDLDTPTDVMGVLHKLPRFLSS